MNLLTQTQVEALCIKVGFPKADAKVASAISMCEAPYSANGKSYSDFDRVGDIALETDKWGPSYGGFQVRSLKADLGDGTYRDASRLPDPTFNCQAALRIYKDAGNKFTDWSTYNSGQFKAYLPQLYPPTPGTYVIIGGDTLIKIANKISGGLYTWRDLALVNALQSPYTIYIGQVLLLPWLDYTVQPGDTLTKIAANYSNGVTVDQLATFNGLLDPNKLSVGQHLRIPRSEFLTT